jgi:hypothetical protein
MVNLPAKNLLTTKVVAVAEVVAAEVVNEVDEHAACGGSSCNAGDACGKAMAADVAAAAVEAASVSALPMNYKPNCRFLLLKAENKKSVLTRYPIILKLSSSLIAECFYNVKITKVFYLFR